MSTTPAPVGATPAPLTLTIHTVGRNSQDELIADVRGGLGADRKWLPPRWFYDSAGSALFERITELPEYYQTRTEASILTDHAEEIAARVRPESLVELGAGSCTKSRILIEACRLHGALRGFVPFDISEAALRAAADGLLADYPDLRVHAMVGDFANHLRLIPRDGRQLIVFLGSTVGNFEEAERQRFLGEIRSLLGPGDALLIGLDLIKPADELVAAYDDSQHVTAAFNLNLLRVLNRELGANFDPDGFEHVARWDEQLHRIEMALRSRRDQRVHLPAADLEVSFSAGELMRTEISVKFTREMAEEMLRAAGLGVTRWFSDEGERFALALARPRAEHHQAVIAGGA